MRKLKDKYSWILLFTWGTYFTVLYARMVSMRPDGLYVGHEYVWSDWSLHFALANIFALKSPSLWFAYHPVYADGKLTYAFLVNLISGLMIRVGFSFAAAFIIPSIALSLLLIEGMQGLLRRVLGSSARGYLAICLFFLSSGLGFIDYLRELFTSPDFAAALLPSRYYSRIDSHGWLAGNYVVGHLLPQRAFLLGMTIAVWSLCGLFKVLLSPESKNGLSTRDKTILVISGLGMGLLPVAHMHSLIAMVVVLAPVGLLSLRKFKLWTWFVIPAGLLSSILYLVFVAGGIQKSGFMSFRPGYMAQGLWDWVAFWARAWGLMIPAAAAGLALLWRQGKPREVIALFSGFFLLFAMANLVLTQPTEWDNSKHFLWCYFGFSGLAAYALAEAWAWRPRKVLSPLVALAAVVLTFTGALELFDIQRSDRHTYRLLSREELDISEAIRKGTGPLDRFLTAPAHNHPVMVWAARPILLGYTAWADNFGFTLSQIENDTLQMYKGGEAASALLRQHRISYVFLGPAEREAFKPDESYFEHSFPVAFSAPGYKVYDVRSLLK